MYFDANFIYCSDYENIISIFRLVKIIYPKNIIILHAENH